MVQTIQHFLCKHRKSKFQHPYKTSGVTTHMPATPVLWDGTDAGGLLWLTGHQPGTASETDIVSREYDVDRAAVTYSSYGLHVCTAASMHTHECIPFMYILHTCQK